jgi:hypothetical protein
LIDGSRKCKIEISLRKLLSKTKHFEIATLNDEKVDSWQSTAASLKLISLRSCIKMMQWISLVAKSGRRGLLSTVVCSRLYPHEQLIW